MEVISKLASSLGHRDEVPNKELAEQLARTEDKQSIKQLIGCLSTGNKSIQADCIKVLYEIGEIDPGLIAPYAKDFIALLDQKNNRLQWGAMTAISSITSENPAPVYAALAKIVAVSDSGSVITKDHCVKILTRLCAVKKYADDAIELLFEQIASSPDNQMPTYAEGAMPFINDGNKTAFLRILNSRLSGIESDTKRKRVEKVIAKLSPKATR